MRKAFFLLFCIGFSCLIFSNTSLGSWPIMTVDFYGETQEEPQSSLAFDLLDQPGIAYHYHDDDIDALKYAHWNGNSWDIETVEDNIGGETSLAFDPQGYPGISYHDDDIDALKYAHWNGTSWNIEIVDSNSWVCSYTSLAFDKSGYPAITYQDEHPEELLKYAHWNGTSWDIYTIYSNTKEGSSLAFDSQGYPGISYHDYSGHLLYAHWNGTFLDIETVEDNIGEETSLAFDPHGYPGISYHDDDIDALKYAHWNGTSWNIEIVDSNSWVCSYTSLAFDKSGYPAITYHDEHPEELLKYAHWNGTSWNIEIVNNNTEETSSLAFDSKGNPGISFCDSHTKSFRYAGFLTSGPLGHLAVSIEPAEARSAGAQWRVDGGAWHDSGDIQYGLTAGEHMLEFKTISGWSKQVDQQVIIVEGQTTEVMGTYTEEEPSAWLGYTTDWGSITNWSTGMIPDLLTTVTIPYAPSGGNFPVIDEQAVAHSVTIENGNINIQSGGELTLGE